MKNKLKLLVVLAAVGALVCGFIFLPLAQWLLSFIEWVRSKGTMGALLFVVTYVLATVFMLPGSVLTLGSGFLYGVVWGTLLVSPASVMGATLAFLVGRFVARDWVAKRIEGSPRFAAIDDALAQGGLKMVILLRLSPVLPFNLLNYGLGVTRVSLGAYVLGSFIGMLPATVLYVYIGSLLTSAGQLLSGDAKQAGPQGATSAFYWGGLAATVLATVLITRSARRALAKRLKGPGKRATNA